VPIPITENAASSIKTILKFIPNTFLNQRANFGDAEPARLDQVGNHLFRLAVGASSSSGLIDDSNAKRDRSPIIVSRMRPSRSMM